MSETKVPPGGPAKTLSTGDWIPQLGLGVWQVPEGPACEQAVRWALECGYRLIDTAQAYGNETSVGRAIRESGIAREEIFLTTKFHPGRVDPRAEAAASLERLRTGYIDLYLVHWPQGGPTWAWSGMEAAVTDGIVRNVGVSNFGSVEIEALMRTWRVPPVVNQIQVSPFENRDALVARCRATGVVVQAYSPLGTGRHVNDPTVERVANRCERTAAQVLIRWAIQRGLSVITKSTHRERIRENFGALDFELDEDSMTTLDRLDTTGRTGDALDARAKWWS